MTEEEIRPIAENYVEEYCYCSDGEYTDGSLVCAGIGTALIVSRQLEKRIAELEQKISVLLSCKNCPENKGGLICAKEYDNKCLAQKIEFIKELQKENAELKADNDARKFAMAMSEKVEKQLRQENAELKDDNKVMADNYSEMEQKFYNNLTKAKDLLAKWVELFKPKSETALPTPIQFDTEQFISEVEK